LTQTNKCALVVTDGMERSQLPSRFGEGSVSNLLLYVLDSVWTVADEIFVIFSRDPGLQLVETIAPFGVKVVVDKDGRSSVLSRVATGFRACNSENCLVVSSSFPFVKPSVLFQLFEGIRGHDAAVPRWENGRTEPLLSVYSRKAFLRATANFRGRTLEGLVSNLYAVNFMDVERHLKPLDPELQSFFRVKSRKDLKTARRIASLKGS
jgi:molybdopterin-guanine dinucleotide biosynthesis protein A